MPSVLVIAPISRTPAGGIATLSSPRVIEAMLRSSRFKGTVIERTVSAVKPSASTSATDPADDREPDREFSLARRRIAPGNGPLLDLVYDLVDLVIDIENVALGLRQQGVAGGAVVAGVGDASLLRQIGHRVDFAFDGG